MTWKSFHRRGEILRDVIATADRRRDGVLPTDERGVAATFPDDLSLLGALQLRWHTRLAGRIERELATEPMDLDRAVIRAWQVTADELPGVLAVVDRQRTDPATPEIATAMRKATAKEHALLALMAGRVSVADDAAARIGAELEQQARATYVAAPQPPPGAARTSLLGRLKAALAA